MMYAKSIRPLKWNSLGSFLSFLCLIHCLILPWMAALLPVTLWLDESVHFWLFCTLVPAAVLAAWNGFRTHRQMLPISLMIAGVVLVGLGTFLPMSSVLETAITVAGSLLLIAGHRLNGRLILIHRIAIQST